MNLTLASRFLALGSAFVFAAPAEAQQLLFLDNFNTPNTTNFDGAPLTGRLSGSVAGTEAVLRSWGAQQQISENQLFLPVGGDSGVRFENAAGPFGAANRYNWAGGLPVETSSLPAGSM